MNSDLHKTKIVRDTIVVVQKEEGEMKKTLVVPMVLLSMILLFSTSVRLSRASTTPILGTAAPLGYSSDPVKFQEITSVEDALADPTPWNVDIIDAEATSNDGEGIYVAVLDTGLLSNYLEFFPESMVDIKEEWGVGFTHDVWYDPDGEGNWSIEYVDSTEYKFSYKPVNDGRGFLTYDDGYPLWAYYPPAGFDIPFPYGSGHGTHVTSIVTGYQFERGPVSAWIAGVAPKVTIIPVLVLDDWIVFADDGNGWWWSGGTDEMVAAGIRYIGDLAAAHGIKIIINMSLGGGSPSPLDEAAIDYAISQGVIVVASAGNEGEEGMGWPGAFTQVISCAAAGWTQEYGAGYYDYYWWWGDVPEKLNTVNYVYDPWTEITYKNNWQTYLVDFSSRPNPDLGQSWKDLDVSAPGCAIRGPYKPYGATQWGFYAVWGTSQAAPHVSGIAALLLQSYPYLGQAAVEAILKNAATGVPMPADGAYISDTFSDFAVWYYWWNDHDAGSGFLTVDEVFKAAKTSRGAHLCVLRFR